MRRALSVTSGHYYQQVTERINALLEHKAVVQKGRIPLLMGITGQSRSWITHMADGHGVEISVLTMARIAVFFDCSLESLSGMSSMEDIEQGSSNGKLLHQVMDEAVSDTIRSLTLSNDQMESDSPEGCRKGDSVLFDIADTDLCRGGLFVLGDQLTVRRVDIRPDGQVALIPVNPRYMTSIFASLEELTSRVPIAGRVVRLIHLL